MKKILFFVLLAFVGVLLAAPWFVGGFAERQIEEQIALGSRADSGVTIITDEYRRHWFSADSRHRVVITDPELVAALRDLDGGSLFGDQPALIVDTRIDHGPVPFSSLEREDGSLAPALSRARSEFSLDLGNGGEPVALPGTLVTTMALDGTTDARFRLEAGATDLAGPGEQLSWDGATIDARINADGSVVTGEGRIGTVEVTNAAGTGVRIGGVEFDTAQRYGGHGIYVGPANVSMGPIEVGDGGKVARVESIAVVSDSDMKGELLDGEARFSFRGLSAGMMAADVEADIAVANMHAPSLAAITETLQALEEAGGEPAMQQTYPLIESDLARLLAAGPTLDIRNFALKLPQGDVRLRMFLAMAAGDDAGAFAMRDVAGRLTATADLTVPKPIVEMLRAIDPDAAGQAEMLIQMGILREEGDAYRLQAEYGDGLLTVNGFPLPVPVGM